MKPLSKSPSPLVADAPLVKCLACGHSNSSDDPSCQACGSSLDLKLCRSCEAINAKKAERCHACGAQFSAPILGRALPAVMTYTIDSPRRTSRRTLALFAVLALAGALVLAYRYYGDFLATAPRAAVVASQPKDARPAPSVTVKADPALPPQAAMQAPPKEAAKATPPKEAPKAVTAPRTVDARPAHRANRAVAGPAHAPSGASPVVLRSDESTKDVPAVVGVSAVLPSVTIARPRVTHTKAMPDAAPLPVAGVVTRPATGPNGCSEPVAALGLCGSNEKGEGK